MKQTLILFSMIAALAFGCADTDTGVAETAETNVSEEAELRPEELGALSAEISRNPDNAQEILAERGLTEEQFEEQVRQTAADPEASEEYAQAFRQDQAGS